MKNITTALMLSLLWLLTRLPFSLQMAIGRVLGLAFYRWHKKRRHIAEVNIQLCFPEVTPDKQAQWVKAHFQSLGMALLETGMAWWPKQRFPGRVVIEGLEYLQTPLNEGQGVLMLGAHFTTLDIGGYLLSKEQEFCVIYREHKNSLFEHVMSQARQRNFLQAVPRRNMRMAIRLLKQGKAVWYAPDQNYGRENSVFVPFFGVQASTIIATMRIAKLGRAAVVPFFTERLADNSGYRLQFLPALEGFPSGDDAADASRVNRLIEDKVREIPSQYLWTHRRFKTRPVGEVDVY